MRHHNMEKLSMHATRESLKKMMRSHSPSKYQIRAKVMIPSAQHSQ